MQKSKKKGVVLIGIPSNKVKNMQLRLLKKNMSIVKINQN